jgi:tetratricopeptide (TPR) repeat protein
VSTNDSSVTAFEAAWDYLWFALRHEESNWLGFVSARTYKPIDQLVLRAEDFIRPLQRGVERIIVKSVADLVLAMEAVTTQRPSRTALVWVDVRMTETSTEPGVLSLLVARMNEHRAAILRNPVGVVVSTTLRLFPSIATPAPDLWSVRSFAIDIDSEIPSNEPVAQMEVDLAIDALRSLAGTASSIGSIKIGTSSVGVATPWDSLAAKAFDLAEHDPVRAAEAAKAALAGEGRFGLSTILRLLDVIDKTISDPRSPSVSLARVEVLRSIFEQSSNPENGYPVLLAMAELTDRLADEQRFRDASRSAETQLEFARLLAVRFGESSDRIRDVSVSLNTAGGIAIRRGDLAKAGAHFSESLEIARVLLVQSGESEERLRDVAVAIDGVASVSVQQGDLKRGELLFREALSLSRSAVDRFGGSPGRLRDVWSSLNNLGEILEKQGDLSGARDCFQESLATVELARERIGESAENLRDEWLSLSRLGGVVRVEGDLATAGRHYERGLGIVRLLVDRFGEMSMLKRDLAIALGDFADIAERQANFFLAHGLYHEALEIAQFVVERFGESPESLRDLSVASNNCGDLAKVTDDLEAAKTHYGKALSLARLIVERFGESPDRLRDLPVALNNSGDVAGSPVVSAGYYFEALSISRNLLASFGESPERLRDLSIGLGKAGQIAKFGDDVGAAESYFAEALKVALLARDRFGELPERVRDIAVACRQLAEVAALQGNRDLASNQATEGLEHLERVPLTKRTLIDDQIRQSLVTLRDSLKVENPPSPT